jgi:hypothetical protein
MATVLHDSFAGAALAVRRVQDVLTEHTAQQAASLDAKRSARDDERRALDDELEQARRRASEAELDWPAQAAAIEARRTDAEQRLNTFERQCIDLGDRRDELLSEVAQLEMEDRLRRARERGWLDHRDMCALPVLLALFE